MIDVERNLDLLGRIATDKVTKLRGVVTSIAFDLYGCVQATVNPGLRPDGKLGEVYWFDVSRLVISSEGRVMNQPDFYFYLDKGPESKPNPAP